MARPEDSHYAANDWCYKVKEEEEDESKHYVQIPREKAPRPSVKLRVREIFIKLACLVMFLLLVIPCWNAIGLLRDPVFVYMTSGASCAFWLLICCILLFVFSYFALQIFLDRIRTELRSESTLLMVSGVFLSTIGILLILFGGPIARGAMKSHKEFNVDCKFGPMTGPLYIAYEELKAFRNDPDCMSMDSVEDCNGWARFPKLKEAKVIKAMEDSYACSGLCQGVDAKGQHIYPPTIFSKANTKLSCDGMSARHMVNFVAEIASQMVAEGCLLVGTAIAITFGQLLAFCKKKKEGGDRMAEQSYGATQ